MCVLCINKYVEQVKFLHVLIIIDLCDITHLLYINYVSKFLAISSLITKFAKINILYVVCPLLVY